MAGRSRRRLTLVPAAAVACALAALLNTAAWTIIVPAFQVPDEPAHYAYTEYLVQHGKPPRAGPQDHFSSSEEQALAALRFEQVRFMVDNGTIWTTSDQTGMRELLDADERRADGNGGARETASEPPLFYALQALPYELGSGGTLLARLTLMRLCSALLAGVTVLFVFLFLREALPAVPEAWTVGALGVAFAPMFAFMSSGVNSDALLYASSAALFYLLARAFRRGLDARLAVAVGAALGAGLMTKFNALGLVPGTALALLLISVRQQRPPGLRSLVLPALALGVATVPVALEMALNATVWDRPVVGATASNFRTTAVHPAIGPLLSYMWQFYVTPLPGMTRHFISVPFRDLWIDGFVGSFGWVEVKFRPAVYAVAHVLLAAIALLAGRALVATGRRRRARRSELLSYAALALGVMGFVAVASYISYLRFHASIAQIRYLFPLLPLYGAVLALAARGAGRRLAPIAGTAIVVLAIAHNVFSQLVVIVRYYA